MGGLLGAHVAGIAACNFSVSQHVLTATSTSRYESCNSRRRDGIVLTASDCLWLPASAKTFVWYSSHARSTFSTTTHIT